MEFRACNSNADKFKLYESVGKSVAEVHNVEPRTFGPTSVRENPYKD